MLKRIVMQLSGRGMALSIQAWAWLKERLWHHAKRLRVSFILVFLSVANLFNQLVQTVLNIKVWRANLITAVQSIKAGLIIVQAKALQIGSLLATTARQILQHARQPLLQIKDRLVVLIKLVQLRLKGIGCAQTPTDLQSTRTGTKSAVAAKQPLQRATKRSKRGN